MIFLLLASLLWCFSFGLIGRYLVDVDSSIVAFIRLSISLVMFLPFLRWRGVPLKTVIRLMIIGAIQYGLMYLFYIHSYRYLAGHQIAMFTIFTPIFVILIYDLMRRRFHSDYLLAAFLAVAGSAFMVWKQADFDAALFGVFLVQMSNLCFAFGQVLYRNTELDDCGKVDRQAEGHRSNNVFNEMSLFGFMYLGAVLVTGIYSGVTSDWKSVDLTTNQVLCLLYLGILPSGVAFFLWNIGAKRVNAAVLATFNNIKIPLAVVVSIVVFRENADILNLLIGGGAIFVSVMYARCSHKRTRA